MPQIFLELDSSGTVVGLKQYSKAAADGAEATDKLDESTKKTGKSLSSLEKKIVNTVTAYVSLRASINALQDSATIFADFDDQLRVAASYSQATAEEFKMMGDAAKLAGATTSKSASESAAGLSELASKGFTVREQIDALIPTIRLAEAAQTDLATATSISSGILKGYGKDVSELERINDVIVGISGVSGANIKFVGDAAKYAIPAARASGEEFESVAAILGVLADQTFEAGQSGNALKNFLISLQDPTSLAKAELEKLGVTTKDAEGNFLGLVPIFKQLGEAQTTLTSSARIFGKEFATAGLAVSSSIGEVERDLGFLQNGIDGITESTAEFQQAGLGGSFRLLQSATESLYIAIGENLAPIISDAAGVLAELASNTGQVASKTTLLVEGVRFLANGLLGIYTAAQVAVDGISGLLAFAVNTSPLYRGLELIAEGLEKIGAIEDNPFDDLRQSVNDFAAAQDGAFSKSEELISRVNSKFDEYNSNIRNSAAEAQKAAAAEQALAKAAEEAGTAAGKQAIAAGKSVEAALKAAEIGKQTYIEQAAAAKQQEAAEKKAAEQAEKTLAARTKQAEAIKQQALAYGATEQAAQEAADAVLNAGNAAAGITTGGVDALNNSLSETQVKAAAAATAVQGIGAVGTGAPTGGEIGYTVTFNTDEYDRKATELKRKIEEINRDYVVRINSDPSGAVELATELDNLEKELAKTETIAGYNAELESLRRQFSETRQEFLDGKLVIDTDPAASEAIRSQIAAVNELKLSTEGLIPGLERVDGVWKQIPDSIATSVEPAVSSLGSMSDATGEIETEWRKVDGVWKEVLPDGTALVEDMTGALSAGTKVIYGFGEAMAEAAGETGKVSEAGKVLEEVEGKIRSASEAAGTLKFDELAASTGALNLVSDEISELKKEIKNLDPASEEAKTAVKRLLDLEAVKGELQNKISGLKKEIYETGEEAKKTGTKAFEAAEEINKIPEATNNAAASVSNLAASNNELAASAANAAATQGDIARAAWSASKTFTTTSLNNVSAINAEIEALRQEEQAIKDMNAIIFGKGADFTARNIYARDRTLGEEKIQALENKKLMTMIENLMSERTGLETTGGRVQPMEVSNNFYGMDRSDALTVMKDAERMRARA